MRAAFLALLLSAASVAGAATVYKWVDASGVVHYSDQPHPGATKLEVGSPQTYSGRDARPDDSPAPGAPSNDGPQYDSCELYSPQSEEVFFSVQSVTARLRVSPGLRPGHQLALALDGRRMPTAVEGSELSVPVFRGTHTLTLVVEDGSGNILCTSPTVTFHVRQPSTQAPNPANRPRF
jgi:hypothetical protein